MTRAATTGSLMTRSPSSCDEAREMNSGASIWRNARGGRGMVRSSHSKACRTGISSDSGRTRHASTTSGWPGLEATGAATRTGARAGTGCVSEKSVCRLTRARGAGR